LISEVFARGVGAPRRRGRVAEDVAAKDEFGEASEKRGALLVLDSCSSGGLCGDLLTRC